MRMKTSKFFGFAHFPSESDSETMLKVLKWGVVPLNLKGHDITPHSFCWARMNSRELVSHFNYMRRGFSRRFSTSRTTTA